MAGIKAAWTLFTSPISVELVAQVVALMICEQGSHPAWK
jgi:hypothetical protein